MQRLVRALILSWLDYGNYLLAGRTAVTLAPLQRVMHAAVRLVENLGFRDPVTESIKAFHWLPIAYRIKYKLCLMMHADVNGRSQAHISETLVSISSLLNRARLRSSTSGTFDVQRVRNNSAEEHFPSLALLLGTNFQLF